MNIYINIEIKKREFESRILLALIAASKGHTVYLMNQIQFIHIVPKLSPGIIFDKSITPNPYRIGLLKKYKSKNHIITSIDEESGLLDESYDDFAKFRYSHETLELASKVFCWGSHDYNTLIDKYSRFKNKFSLTGSPRADLWRPEFDKYYKKNKKEFDYILIPSNFGTIMGHNQFWSLVDKYKKTKVTDRGFNELILFGRFTFQLQLISHFVELTKYINKKFPQFKIVIRPHPIDAVEAWQALVGENENVIITSEGNISKWIRNAKLIIHNGCTTGIESAASKIPTVVFKPINSDFERKNPNKFGMQAETLEQIDLIINNLISGQIYNSFIKENSENTFRDMIYQGKTLASENIINEFERLDHPSLNKHNYHIYVRLLILFTDIRIFLVRIKNAIFRKKISQFNSKLNKFTAINTQEVLGLYNGFKGSIKLSKNVRIEKLNKYILRLGSK